MSYTPSSSLALGRSFGRYELLFRVASGGMAEVYAGRVRGEAGFQKLVAIKCMLPQLSDDPEFVKMFLDEARLAAHISSPHVVSTLDLGRSDDTEESLYIVMELVVGTSMSKLLRRRAKRGELVPVGVGAELIAQAAQGLHDAHEATTPVGNKLEVVHRDVSPQNILIGVDGRVRLTDFGVARAVHRVTQTVAGRVKGKFAYCSPEQIEAQAVDRRSDVFSLGVVAWETLAMQRLFAAEHPLETMERVKSMPVPSLTSVREDVPGVVSDVIEWALSRDPACRPPTARAFSEALVEATRDSGQLTPREGVVSFLEHTAGSTLERMRHNLKAALAQSAEFHDLAQLEDGAEAEGEDRGRDPEQDGASGVTTKRVDDMGPTAVLRGRERPDAEPSQAATVAHPKAGGDAGPTVVDPRGSSWLSSGSSDSLSESVAQPPVAGPAAPSDAADASSPVEDASSARARVVDWVRRHPLVLVAAAAGVTVVLVAGALVVTNVGGGDEPAAPAETQAASGADPGASPGDETAEAETRPSSAERSKQPSKEQAQAEPASAAEGDGPDTPEASAGSKPASGEASSPQRTARTRAGGDETSTARRAGSSARPDREPAAADRDDERPTSESEPGARDGTGSRSQQDSEPGEPTRGPSLMDLEDFERDLGQ